MRWVVLLGVLWPGIAAGRSLAVVPLAGSGAVVEEDLFQMGEVVSATLRERGHDVLGPVEAAEKIDERVPGCIASRRPACWMEAASQMARDAIVHGRVHRDASSGAATVALIALDARDGRVLVESSHGGSAATRPALVALARIAAAHLSDEMPALQRHPRLRVETQPSGAALSVNGNPVGRTPWSAEVAAGVTTVHAQLAGFRSAVREVSLSEGQNRTLALLLPPLEGGGSAGRAAWQRPVGIGGLVFAAAGVGLGTYGLVREGDVSTGQRIGLGLVPLTVGLGVAIVSVVVGFVLELQ
jgi:hypothetical protein